MDHLTVEIKTDRLLLFPNTTLATSFLNDTLGLRKDDELDSWYVVPKKVSPLWGVFLVAFLIAALFGFCALGRYLGRDELRNELHEDGCKCALTAARED